jgi:hypothetical protein
VIQVAFSGFPEVRPGPCHAHHAADSDLIIFDELPLSLQVQAGESYFLQVFIKFSESEEFLLFFLLASFSANVWLFEDHFCEFPPASHKALNETVVC